LAGLLFSKAGISHEQQVVVQVIAAATARDSAALSDAELSAALDRLHGDVPSPAADLATVTLSAAENSTLLAAGLDLSRCGGAPVCWHCHKLGHV